MIPDDIFLKIVRSAVKAPSGHNTQPWLFAKEENGICMKPDFKKELPVADPLHRELFISLGCAAETALIAARFYGYNPTLQINVLHSNCSIKIALTQNDRIEQPDLFSYITTRQTTRNLYDKKSIPGHDIESLKTSVTEASISILFYTEQHETGKFAPFIAEASSLQMINPDFKKELIHWMRFSEREAMQKGDGLFTACNGVPSMGRFFGSFVLQNFVNAKSENKRMLKQLENSAAVVLFTSAIDNIESWIKTGMAFQRFALVATRLGLSHSYLNLPCQIPQVREMMMHDLGLAGFPQLIIRLGYSEKMHYSFRRRVHEFHFLKQ